MSNVTLSDVNRFVDTLDPRLREVWKQADTVTLELADYDTLSDDFQIAANIVEVFWRHVRERSA